MKPRKRTREEAANRRHADVVRLERRARRAAGFLLKARHPAAQTIEVRAWLARAALDTAASIDAVGPWAREYAAGFLL